MRFCVKTVSDPKEWLENIIPRELPELEGREDTDGLHQLRTGA
jgi:hypothetical protein